MISGLPISEALIKKLKEKLNVGNLRSIQLNCIPGKSATRLDLADLATIHQELPNQFINDLVSGTGKISFDVSFSNLDLNFDSESEDKSKKLGLISKRLNTLNNYNKEDLQEFGYESFGFGYPIVVFSPQEAPNKVIKAPLFIWHLSVKKDLRKTNTWNLSRSRDHEIEFNNLLRSYVGQLSNTNIEGFTEDELIDGVLDSDELLSNCVKFIENFSTVDKKVLSKKLSEELNGEIKAIPNRKKCDESATGIPKIYWGGVFGRYHQRNEAIRQELNEKMADIIDSANPDNEIQTEFNHLLHSETAALTDPSQIGILNYLKGNRHLVIQGPPGTGKSESITGIIINALEHGKKCLVVCEKKTAMDVLRKNLSQISPEIGNLVAVVDDVSRDRKALVESVRNRYESIGGVEYERPPETNLSETLEYIESYIEDIHYRKNFFYNEDVLNDNKTKGWTAAVGKELLTRFKNKDEQLLKKIQNNFKIPVNIDFNEAVNKLKYLEAGVGNLGYVNLLQWIPKEKIVDSNPSLLNDDLNEVITTEKEQLSQFISAFEEHLIQARNELSKKIDIKIEELRGNLDVLKKQLATLLIRPSFKKDDIWYKILKNSPIKSKKQKRDIEAFEVSLKALEDISKIVGLLGFDVDIKCSRDVEVVQNDVEKIKIWFKDFSQTLGEYKTQVYDSIISKPFIDIKLDEGLKSNLKIWRDKSSQALQGYYQEKINWESTFNSITLLKWYLNLSNDLEKANQDGFLKHYEWQENLRKESSFIQELIQFFLDEEAQNWDSYFSEYYYHSQLTSNLNHKFSGGYDIKLKFLKDKRKGIIEEIKKKIPKYWKSEQSKIKDTNIPQLYNKRGGRGQRRNSLRKIAERSFESLTAYFPVIMVSPNVCASMFKLEPDLFDYVIFDEASQLKVEESITTLIRGERKVISGDSKQMPPSYWFSSQNEVEDDVEENEHDPYQSWQENLLTNEGARDLAESESLLEFAELCGFKSFHLDFHYRSHHPLLIEFSNAAFYKGRLHPLPERIAQSPIQFIPVNGIYENQQNRDEANIVIEVLRNLHTDENGFLPTVGIATFNQKQKNLIWELLKREAQLDSKFRTKYKELEENGLFVKNLENIQGDERDIIILSTTFGKDANGQAIRNYGPITRSGLGQRLLNVIITRAKKKIFVLTSVPEEYYLDYRQELNGNQVFERGYFHAYLAYAKAVSDKDKESIASILGFLRGGTTRTDMDTLGLTESPFEEAIYQALIEKIDSERVTLQHKAGGFRIDIAIKSKKTGKEYLAIECDGAAYHSSVEAYAWDNYRQEILEEYGFVFHRIWSRDFWENSDREIEKLVKFIREQDEIDKGYEALYDPVASDLFIDDLLDETTFVEIPNETENDTESKFQEVEETKTLVNKRPDTVELDTKNKRIVQVGHIVTLLEVGTKKEIRVTFKKGAITVSESEGITVLSEKSPLGEVVIGKKTGETVELSNIEKYYKIIDIKD